MLCQEHRRIIQGPCIMCGTPLCDRCVARQEGRKFYCKICAKKIPFIPKRVVPEIKKEEVVQRRTVQQSRTGYFDFSQFKK